jgi:DNA-binding NarL/FixJ family response regulator
MPSTPIKVSIVEDDSSFRGSMVILIGGAEGFRCVGDYPNAEVALAQIPKNWPDVVLMDINLPKMSGIMCVSRLKAMRPDLQVIMLTAYVDGQQIFDSLKAGASGYLIKKTSPGKILEALTEVHAGGSPMSTTIARRIVQFFQQEQSANVRNLTARECELLNLLAKGHQDKEIADMLSISALTVRAHLRNIYEKLHARSRTEAVVKFLGKEASR